MKIKNSLAVNGHHALRRSKMLIANKENIALSEYKANKKPQQRRKSVFGDDITKRMNETAISEREITFRTAEIQVNIPAFLKKQTILDPLVASYEEEILKYIVQNCNDKEFCPSYIKKLRKNSKRKFTIQRIYNVYKRFKLKRKTLYLAVYYFDKYLWKFPQRDTCKTYLIAEACMLIAMKYEEIYPPLLNQWAPGREDAIISIQASVLKALDFNLAITTPQHFLEIYQSKNPQTPKQENKLHEIVLDLYLFTGNLYGMHPLKIVQEVFESFRTTSFLEHGTVYDESSQKVKQIIAQNPKIWEFLLEMEIQSQRKNA